MIKGKVMSWFFLNLCKYDYVSYTQRQNSSNIYVLVYKLQ